MRYSSTYARRLAYGELSAQSVAATVAPTIASCIHRVTAVAGEVKEGIPVSTLQRGGISISTFQTLT